MANHPADVVLAIETSSPDLYQARGVPVWPLGNEDERQALAQMVENLGARLEFVDADEVERRAFEGDELVVGLGPGAHAHARLYAHLTRRACELVDDLEQLAALPRLAELAVVVTTYAHVDEQLMDLLYDREALTNAPGVIFSYDDAQLGSQVLARAAARQCSQANFSRRRVDVNPTINFGAQLSAEMSILGGQASAEQLREALSAGAGLLTLYTHSDGIDAYLRKDLVLCPIERAEPEGQPEPAPSCVLSGTCHRCQRPMSEVIGSEVLLSPDVVRANVMVYCVCWGLYPSQHVHSPAYALSRRLLESFKIGALLTSWEINIQRVPLTAGLFHDIARGLSLGRALARHLASPEARSNYHKLCLIGDPAIRLPESNIRDPLANIQRVKKPAPPSPRCIAGLNLLRAMIGNFSAHAPDTDDAASIRATLTGYESMLLDGLRHDEQLAERFRAELLDYLSKQDTMLSKCWSRFSDTIETLADKPRCPVCARRAITRHFSLRIPGLPPRRETLCPSCGSIEDSPADRRLSLVVEPGGRLRLSGDLPRSRWRARVTVERFFTDETYKWDWPAGPEGAPAPSFQVPRSWPLVPFRLSVILVHGDSEFSVLGCLYRGGLAPVPTA